MADENSRFPEKIVTTTVEAEGTNVATDMGANPIVAQMKRIFEIKGKLRRKHKIVNDLWAINEGEDLARNHVIPGSTLSNLFNMMLEDVTFYPTLRKMLDDLLRNAINRSKELKRSLHDHISKTWHAMNYLTENKAYTDEEIEKIKVDDKEGINIIHSLFYWRPDNCYIGPSQMNRLNDSDDYFDVEARYIVPHYEGIYNFYLKISSFMESKTIESLENVYSCHSELTKKTSAMFHTCSEDWMTISDHHREKMRTLNEMVLKLKKLKVNKPKIYKEENNITRKFNKKFRGLVKRQFGYELNEEILNTASSIIKKDRYLSSAGSLILEKAIADGPELIQRLISKVTQNKNGVEKLCSMNEKALDSMRQVLAGSIELRTDVLEEMLQVFTLESGADDFISGCFSTLNSEDIAECQKIDEEVLYQSNTSEEGERKRSVSYTVVKTFLMKQLKRIIASLDPSMDAAAALFELKAKFFTDFLPEILHLMFLKSLKIDFPVIN